MATVFCTVATSSLACRSELDPGGVPTMEDNDDAGCLNAHIDLTFFASRLAPTEALMPVVFFTPGEQALQQLLQHHPRLLPRHKNLFRCLRCSCSKGAEKADCADRVFLHGNDGQSAAWNTSFNDRKNASTLLLVFAHVSN